MPFKGFYCEHSGEKVVPDECIACARAGAKGNCQMTAPVVAGIVRSNLWHARAVGKNFSVTQIISCPRQQRLRREVDWWVKPSDAYWAFRGQLFHEVGERYANEYDFGAIVERRIRAKINGETLSGQVDIYYPDRGHLVDYKTTKRLPGSWKVYYCGDCGKVMKESPWVIRKNETFFECPHCHSSHRYKARKENLVELPPRPRDHDVTQVNFYAWLLRQNGMEVNSAEIVYADMGGMLRCDVPLWDDSEIAPQIEHGLAQLTTEHLPRGVAGIEDQGWRCKFCEVADKCGQVTS